MAARRRREPLRSNGIFVRFVTPASVPSLFFPGKVREQLRIAEKFMKLSQRPGTLPWPDHSKGKVLRKPSRRGEGHTGTAGKTGVEAMKLNATQVKRTLSQFNAEVLPDSHPVVPQLNTLFGDHTFFLDSDGLNVLEPAETLEVEGQTGEVVRLA